MDAVTLREYRALAQIRFELRRFLAFSEGAARTAGVEPRQHQLLLAIKGLPAGERPNIRTIAGRLLLRHHSVVELVHRSVEQGLIETARCDDDARVVLLAITPRGEALLEDLSRAHREELRSLTPRLVGALEDVVGQEVA